MTMTLKPFCVLFVCTGNICRSPTAEAVFRHRLSEEGLHTRITHDSAGTRSHHVGEPPDPRSQAALTQRGIDMSDLRARNVRREDFYTFDLILAMDRSHYTALKRFAPPDASATIALYLEYAHGEAGEVPDPYYGTPSDFTHVVNLVDDATAALLTRLKREKQL